MPVSCLAGQSRFPITLTIYGGSGGKRLLRLLVQALISCLRLFSDFLFGLWVRLYLRHSSRLRVWLSFITSCSRSSTLFLFRRLTARKCSRCSCPTAYSASLSTSANASRALVS